MEGLLPTHMDTYTSFESVAKKLTTHVYAHSYLVACFDSSIVSNILTKCQLTIHLHVKLGYFIYICGYK